MKIDYKCINERCPEHNKKIEKDIKMKDIQNIIPCDKCQLPLARIWTSIGIKTNDGYKT